MFLEKFILIVSNKFIITVFKVVRRLVARMDHLGHSPLHFCKRDRSLSEDPAQSGRSQSPGFGTQQIGREYQGRARIGAAGVDLGHAEDVQAPADQHDSDVQQSGDGLLLHGLHALLDLHAEIH